MASIDFRSDTFLIKRYRTMSYWNDLQVIMLRAEGSPLNKKKPQHCQCVLNITLYDFLQARSWTQNMSTQTRLDWFPHHYLILARPNSVIEDALIEGGNCFNSLACINHHGVKYLFCKWITFYSTNMTAFSSAASHIATPIFFFLLLLYSFLFSFKFYQQKSISGHLLPSFGQDKTFRYNSIHF